MSSDNSSSTPDFKSSETFATALMQQIKRDDVHSMVDTQREMLGRFEKTNEMLINFNILSASRFGITSQEFKKHTLVLYEMKKDLDTVFKRIRVLKQRLGKMYPDSFQACSDVFAVVEADQEDDGDVPYLNEPDTAGLIQSDRARAGPSGVEQTGLNRTQSEHSSLADKKMESNDKPTVSIEDDVIPKSKSVGHIKDTCT